MMFIREWLGGSEIIDLNDTREGQGWSYWIDLICDAEVAERLAQRIIDEDEVVVNENDGIFIERYILIGDIPCSICDKTDAPLHTNGVCGNCYIPPRPSTDEDFAYLPILDLDDFRS